MRPTSSRYRDWSRRRSYWPGLLIGSALAAGLDTGKNSVRTDLADIALVVLVAATIVAVVLVAAVLWRLLRPDGPHRHGRGKSR